jgi:hypothetical protein
MKSADESDALQTLRAFRSGSWEVAPACGVRALQRRFLWGCEARLPAMGSVESASKAPMNRAHSRRFAPSAAGFGRSRQRGECVRFSTAVGVGARLASAGLTELQRAAFWRAYSASRSAREGTLQT